METNEALEEIARQYNRERDTEYDRYRASEAPVKISRWRPRQTMHDDDNRRAARREHMRQWTAQWWAARGYRMIMTDENEDEFTVEPLKDA